MIGLYPLLSLPLLFFSLSFPFFLFPFSFFLFSFSFPLSFFGGALFSHSRSHSRSAFLAFPCLINPPSHLPLPCLYAHGLTFYTYIHFILFVVNRSILPNVPLLFTFWGGGSFLGGEGEVKIVNDSE